MNSYFAQISGEEESEQKRRMVRSLFGCMTLNERKVIYLLLGFGGKEHTYEEAARVLHSTASEVEEVYWRTWEHVTVVLDQQVEFVKGELELRPVNAPTSNAMH